jgi:ATP-dependent DNA helicase RecQ
VIFHDATLREIARLRPSSLEMLRGIPGIGARKLEAYGVEIVGLAG